jgi:glyoxylase-like metal-dependent hydrolase (beta-lactamase superfamily II)
MRAEQVADGVYRLRDGLVNCYLLEEDGAITVVDAGWRRSWPKLQEAVAALGSNASVKAVILTHGHPDHLGSAEKARRSWNIPVLAHHDEIGRVKGQAKGASPFTLVPGLLPWLWRPSAFGFVLHAAAHGFMTPEWVSEVTGFEDGAELDVPGRPKVVFTPGHTEAHCSFYLQGQRVLISGDALVTLDVLTREQGPRLLPKPLNVDNALARTTLDKLRPMNASLILPGHGEPYNGSLESAVNEAVAAYER